MMTKQEALAILRRELERKKDDAADATLHIYSISWDIAALKLTIGILEKTEDKKPDNIHKSGEDMTIGTCSCGARVNNYMKFCDQCGKRLDWSESDG